MATIDETAPSDNTKHEDPLQPRSATQFTPPQTFQLFPSLPTELQLLIWNHALDNTFVVYRRMKQRSGIPGKMVYADTTRLDKHRWMRLMLACKLSHEVVKMADEKVRKGMGEKKYWIFGRKWDEMVAFHREEQNEEFEEDADLRW